MFMMNLEHCSIAFALVILTCSVLASDAAMEPSGPVGEKEEQVSRVVLKRIVHNMPDANEVLGLGEMQPKGTWEEVLAPDTLDLAERARLAINALTNLRSKEYYAVTQTFAFGADPPTLGPPNWLTGKYLRTLPLMRAMCGSDHNLEVERDAMRVHLERIREDGLMYCPIAGDGPPANTSYPVLNGVALQAMLAWHDRDRSPGWMDWMRLLAEGLEAATIQVEDYAYIPPECSLSPDGEWHWTLRGAGSAPGYIPYQPPAEPVHDSQGQEGCVKFEQSHSIEALVGYYKLTGDQASLEHARRLARFCLKPSLWSHNTEDESTPPGEHGVWTGHFHGNMVALRALLALAMVDNDESLKQLVREGYEHARRHGAIRLGFMPGWIKPLVGRPKTWVLELNEGCGIADMVILAVKLSDARLGDYWDDVDSIVRNHFIELQATDIDLMRNAGAGSRHDDVLKGFVGGFTQAGLTANTASALFGCCTANGSRALYYVWESITRFDGHTATVNLLLNRSSPWMDVDSYLPYQGKVVLRNKKAKEAFVRFPGWLDAGGLTCSVNGKQRKPVRVSNGILFSQLKSGDVICVEFPVPHSTERYTIGTTAYTATFGGSTVEDITPRETQSESGKHKYPFFMREHIKATKVPMRRCRRFIADRLPRLP